MEVKDLFVVRPTNEEQEEFIITVGKHLATTKRFKKREQAETYIKYPKWDTTFALIAEIMESKEEQKRIIKQDAKGEVNSIINDTIKQKNGNN